MMMITISATNACRFATKSCRIQLWNKTLGARVQSSIRPLSGSATFLEAKPVVDSVNAVLLRQDIPLTTQEGQYYTTLTLNQPKRFHPLSLQVLNRLEQELIEADYAFPECRCVVVNAAPSMAFCAGHDMKEIYHNLPQQNDHNDGDKENTNVVRTLFETCARVMESFSTIRPVTIAAVDGIAVAAGCQLVAATDLAIATADSRFALSGIHNGLVCSTPIVPVSRSIRHSKHALAMLLTGDFVSSQQALEYGLINEIVPDRPALEQATVDWVNRITRHSSFAIARGKDIFYQQYELPLHDAYTMATERIVDDILTSHDACEGISAFVEKRKLTWK